MAKPTKTNRRQQTLLEMAKEHHISYRRSPEVSEEELELVLAWVKGEITTGQYTFAVTKHFGWKTKNNGNLYRIATVLRISQIKRKIRIERI